MKSRILIVEDDPSIALGLVDLYESESFEVRHCADGLSVAAVAREWNPALVILDIMLPGKSGFEICTELRQAKMESPILMLTAKGQEIDKVIGLELGADDYVVKPFGVRELLARTHALLRRSSKQLSAEAREFSIGASRIDITKMRLLRDDLSFDITLKELKLLTIFHLHPDEVLSRDRLLNEVWGIGYFGNTRTLDQTIVQLRKKLGDDGSAPKLIRTVHGVGYRLAISS